MPNQFIILIFQLVVLLFSVMVHEVSHGVVAHALGDNTAKDAGRLTLNPLKHLDPFGSVFLPIFLFLISGGAMVFGWAKPVPYNPNNLKNPARGAALIGAAGPMSNFILAIIFGILLRIVGLLASAPMLPLLTFLNIIVFINVLLGVFNLVPIPPLDGSRLLFALVPGRYDNLKIFLERYSLPLLLAFLFFGFGLIMPIVNLVYSLITGKWGIF